MSKKAWNKISHFHIIVSLIPKANKQTHLTLLSCLIQTFIEWQGINCWFANLMIQYWNKMRSYSEISYAIISKYCYILAMPALVWLSLISEAILLSGNIQKYKPKTAFKILHISVRMTSEVVTAISKVKIRFNGQRWRRFTAYIWWNIRLNIFWNGLKRVLPLINSIFMLHSISMFSQGSSTNSWRRQRFVTNCTSILSRITNFLYPLPKRWVF